MSQNLTLIYTWNPDVNYSWLRAQWVWNWCAFNLKWKLRNRYPSPSVDVQTGGAATSQPGWKKGERKFRDRLPSHLHDNYAWRQDISRSTWWHAADARGRFEKYMISIKPRRPLPPSGFCVSSPESAPLLKILLKLFTSIINSFRQYLATIEMNFNRLFFC